MGRERLEGLRSRVHEMVESLAVLVDCESPSAEPDDLDQCAELIAHLSERICGWSPETLRDAGRPHLLWSRPGANRVFVLGHFDTVWPRGTVDRWSFGTNQDRATGPGSFDMKAGIVQGLFGLASARDLSGVQMLLTSDEETGSATSRELIETLCREAKAVLVLEPSYNGRLKTARKGLSFYRLTIEGRAAHAGIEPESGANALVEAAHQIIAIPQLASRELGTTVVPTTARAGTAENVVPASATVTIDVRALSGEEQRRVDAALRGLATADRGTTAIVSGGINRPPLPPDASHDLFEIAVQAARRLQLDELHGATVGGASDGNLTAAAGIPTLDGLGAVGGNAHAEGEWISIPALPERAALFAELIDDLTSQDDPDCPPARNRDS